MTLGLVHRNDYLGAGATVTYPYGFRILANEDLRVTVRDPDGVETVLALTTHYTVTGKGNPNGGSVVLVDNKTFPWIDANKFFGNGWRLTIRRVVALTQQTDLRNQAAFYAEVHETQFDKQTMIDQQQQDALDRTLLFPETETPSAALRSVPLDRAGKFLAFGASKEPTASAGTGADSGLRTDLADTALDTNGAGLVGFTRSDAGSVGRSLHDFLSERPSLADFGLSDDAAAAIDAAAALGRYVFVPPGTHQSDNATQTGSFFGDGQIADVTTGNTRGKIYTSVTTQPSAFGVYGSVITAFNGDLSKSPFAVEHRISGAATLQQPSSGYVYTPEAYPHFTFLFNSSGHNENAGSNDGRTAAVAYRTYVYQAGQGDAVGYSANVTVASTRAGATHYLANPAGVVLNGGVRALVDLCSLTAGEFVIEDQGFDCRGSGYVLSMQRDNKTGGLEQFWSGFRVQSNGDFEIDGAFQAQGKVDIGLDLGMATCDRAAIAIPVNALIEFGASSTTDSAGLKKYSDTLAGHNMRWVSASSVFEFKASDTAVFRFGANKLGFYGATAGAKPTITGAHGSNAALQSLLTELATLGLIVDGSS